MIGVGRTVIKYFAKDEGMLSFSNNKPVKIFSKGAGSNPDLWGVMVSQFLYHSPFSYSHHHHVFRSTGGGGMLIRDMFRRQESIRKTLSLKFLQNSTKVNRRRRQLLMMRSLKLKYKAQKSMRRRRMQLLMLRSLKLKYKAQKSMRKQLISYLARKETATKKVFL